MLSAIQRGINATGQFIEDKINKFNSSNAGQFLQKKIEYIKDTKSELDTNLEQAQRNIKGILEDAAVPVNGFIDRSVRPTLNSVENNKNVQALLKQINDIYNNIPSFKCCL